MYFRIAQKAPEVSDSKNNGRSCEGCFQRGGIIYVSYYELDAFVGPSLALWLAWITGNTPNVPASLFREDVCNRSTLVCCWLAFRA